MNTMNVARVLSVAAGVSFGLWPLLLSRSGQSGNVNSAIFAAFVLVGVLPFAFKSGMQPITATNAVYILGAGIFGVVGMLTFTRAFAITPKENLGWVFVLMILVQITVPVIYQAIVGGEFSAKKIAGLAAAAVAIWLLN